MISKVLKAILLVIGLGVAASLVVALDKHIKDTLSEVTESPVVDVKIRCYQGITLLEFYQQGRLQSVIQPLEHKKGKFSDVGLPIKCDGDSK